MDPQKALEAFWSALSRRAWQDAADLVHPEYARRRQAHDLELIAGYFAATDHREQIVKPTDAILLMIKPGTDLSDYYSREVHTFPGHPTLNDLAALEPNDFLARSMAALASEDCRPPDSPRSLPEMQIIKVDEFAEDARVECRILHVKVEDEADAVFRVHLRKHMAEWRIVPEFDEFMAPVPWASEEPPPGSSPHAAV
jgi:hypothetical protein